MGECGYSLLVIRSGDENGERLELVTISSPFSWVAVLRERPDLLALLDETHPEPARQEIRIDSVVVIIHDNTMNAGVSISEQLKNRRLDLGLSLTEVARRAGTSAATLSRYENGWTRFETYTLRKLALALNCELEITLYPRKSLKTPAITPQDAAHQLARLFWDHPLTDDDLKTYPTWVVERVLDFGSLSDIALLRACMGTQAFLTAVASAHRLSPRTANFWHNILKMEGIPCTKKDSRNTAWIS